MFKYIYVKNKHQGTITYSDIQDRRLDISWPQHVDDEGGDAGGHAVHAQRPDEQDLLEVAADVVPVACQRVYEFEFYELSDRVYNRLTATYTFYFAFSLYIKVTRLRGLFGMLTLQKELQ